MLGKRLPLNGSIGRWFKAVECIDEFNFLFLSNIVGSLNIFKSPICLVGSIRSKEGAAQLAVGEDLSFGSCHRRRVSSKYRLPP